MIKDDDLSVVNLWPTELASEINQSYFKWSQPNSNIVLDFHGDPSKAKLCVLSDGNHHMALQEVVQKFLTVNPDVEEIFYSTTPPRILSQIVHTGGMQLGNLSLGIKPHIVISPKNSLAQLQAESYIKQSRPFMNNRGCVLLVNNDNPKNISGVADLLRDDIKLFISNPDTESVSFNNYRDTLVSVCNSQGLNGELLKERLTNGHESVVHGEQIHHREALHSFLHGEVDVAILYYHLALRYTRILPDNFAIVQLRDLADENAAVKDVSENTIYAGMVGDGGEWGRPFFDFLFSQEVTDIYTHHGLLRSEGA